MPKHFKKIGCLGMSANPPHLGHLKIARKILRKEIVDEVWLIPCLFHPFEKKLIDWKYRWKMVKLMSNGRVRACDIEFKKGGISYTIDTVLALKKKFPRHHFFWIVGSDIIKNKEYKKWKNWRKLIKEIEFLVIQRKGFRIRKVELPPSFHSAEIEPIVDVSSTKIRKRISNGQPVESFLSPKVEKYIFKKGFYKQF